MVCFSVRGMGKGGHERKKRESQAMMYEGVLGCLISVLVVVCGIFCICMFFCLICFCAEWSAALLFALSFRDLQNNQIASLPAGVFDNLTELTEL